MTQATVIAPAPVQESTCATCPKFKDYDDRDRGECTLFDRVVRRHHSLTQDCQQQIESEQLKELLSNHRAFLKPIANNLPGIKVMKQDPEYSYSKIGYIGKNYAGWFAHDPNGLTVAEGLTSKLAALTILLNR